MRVQYIVQRLMWMIVSLIGISLEGMARLRLPWPSRIWRSSRQFVKAAESPGNAISFPSLLRAGIVGSDRFVSLLVALPGALRLKGDYKSCCSAGQVALRTRDHGRQYAAPSPEPRRDPRGKF